VEYHTLLFMPEKSFPTDLRVYGGREDLTKDAAGGKCDTKRSENGTGYNGTSI